MKRIEIVSVSVDGQPATIGAGGVIGEFKPNTRVEVVATSKLKTALVVNRDGQGNYVSRRIGEGGEFTLKTVANHYLFLWPQNLVQLVWTYQGALKIMSCGVIRHNKEVRFIEHFVFHGPILPQAEGIFIPGAKAWEDLLRLARVAEILPDTVIKTTFSAKPRIPQTANQAVVYWYNPLLRGNVSEEGKGGNGYGQALLYHGNKLVTASFAASNFVNGTPPEEIKRGTIIRFNQILMPGQYTGHNPRLLGIRVITP